MTKLINLNQYIHILNNNIAFFKISIMDKDEKKLWEEAIKWPLYSVVIIPILLSAAFNLNAFEKIELKNLFAFTFAAILILFWENLTNDLFDSETGIDEFKFHSVVNIIKNKNIISFIAYLSLSIGLIIIYLIALSINIKIIFLVILCCFLGYLYQGPPFRLGYFGLGEPLCWIAFGPLAHSAALMALNPNSKSIISIPWRESFLLGTGPSLAITLVLFCSHFHQINEDKKHGKKSPLVILGTKNASSLVPFVITFIYIFEFSIILIGFIPPLTILYLLSTPYAYQLINLLKTSHNNPNKIKKCKFIALKFQTINGLGLILGLILNFLT